MSRRIAKMAPILVVLGALAYFCWPYVDEPVWKLKGKSADKGPETLSSLLSPPPAPRPDRDPFDSRMIAKSAAPAKAPPAKSPPVKAALVATRPANAMSAAPGASAKVVVAASHGLALDATYLRGARRIASINGTVYTEGDQIKSAGTTTACYTLTRVYWDKVVLQCEGQTVELSYPEWGSKPAAQSKAPSRETANHKSGKTG